jgi:coenzyme F420 hydrogenase subunit beta
MNKKYRNVCDVIVPNDLCIGCGLCAGICPPQVLDMRFNQYGEYIPLENREGCLPNCSLCLQACPFWDQNDNEDTLAWQAFSTEPELHHRVETGHYLKTFAGYSLRSEQRLNAASGGLATWFLRTLLEQNVVDRVICVTPNDDSDKLFHFTVLDTPDDISKSAKSCYYPVEMSGIIREILQTEARYAVIGLPCFLKGLRLAMRTNRRLRNRVNVLAGLVCGQTKSKFFAEYLCALGGGDPNGLTKARFRIKDPERPANDYGFYFENESTVNKSGTIFWLEGMNKAWGRGYFKPNACNYCDDTFAEVADVVFMDAWLDRYINDSQGTNLVMIRRASLMELFEQGQRDGGICLEEIPIEEVIHSQQGVIDIKRSGLAERLGLAKMWRWRAITIKRVKPSRISLYRSVQLWLQHKLISMSKEAFLKQKAHGGGLECFERKMRPILFLMKLVNYVPILFSRVCRLVLNFIERGSKKLAPHHNDAQNQGDSFSAGV